MSNQINDNKSHPLRWYNASIPLRGFYFEISDLKHSYNELSGIIAQEAEDIISKIRKKDDQSDEEFQNQIDHIRKNAFRITVSIICGEDEITVYGDTVDVFTDEQIQYPIKRIFFTNENSYKWVAGGQLPPNRFSAWINFTKPPLFDPNPLLSEPTQNDSKVSIDAESVGFFRAVQSIISLNLKRRKTWYSIFHEKFSYDLILWLFWIPYSIYNITNYGELIIKKFPSMGDYRYALYIYAFFISLAVFRFLFGYFKWTYPVNVFSKNTDVAAKHRVFFGGLALGVIGSIVAKIFGF